MRSRELDQATAARLAGLALDCVLREYPNKIAHLLHGDADVDPPRRLTPAFYGCFDWHSAVHAHWLLARAARLFPEPDFAADARAVLDRNLTPGNITAEVRYQLQDREGFERPYGLAWLLALGAELRLARHESGPGLVRALRPLELVAVKSLSGWLEKLPRPDRSGQHANTAFAMGLALDWSRTASSERFEGLLLRRAREFYLADRDAPVVWEPAGEDFLSPCLSEADLMRRVLDRKAFAAWLEGFLPRGYPLEPVRSPDPSDGKLAHLDGLNLSRAWMLEAVAAALPPADPRREAMSESAAAHAQRGLAAVTGEHYEGGHWLGTFALYLLTADQV